MYKRLIPSLLLNEGVLVKGTRFSNHKYVGDPLNAVRIFNDKGVDELNVMDISTSKRNNGIDFDVIKSISGECFSPLSYGGGVTCLDDVLRLVDLGVDKVYINSAFIDNPKLVYSIARRVGSQTVAVSLDYRASSPSKIELYKYSGSVMVRNSIVSALATAVDSGAGEILLTSINREGTMNGNDYSFIDSICNDIPVPILIGGGVAHNEEIIKLLSFESIGGVVVGAAFTFYGRHRAVLINYPNESDIPR